MSNQQDDSMGTLKVTPAVFKKMAKIVGPDLAKQLYAVMTTEQLNLGGVGVPGDNAGFPEDRSGSVSGTNGLFRLNYFNGRFLTAEAMRREQAYWDARALAVGQIHPSGIAWGLGLNAPSPGSAAAEQAAKKEFLERRMMEGIRINSKQTDHTGSGTLDLHASIELQPGLAFDPLGRPIIVGTPFKFTLDDLFNMFLAKPFRVVGGGTQFSPCICVEPYPPGGIPAGPTPPPGAYLLVICPEERPEGEAKVYGEVCPDPSTIHCEADGWRGGFGLSMVAFHASLPADVPLDAWALRGLMSAYYFDVYEHSLADRWGPEFARDGAFCQGLGPYQRQPHCVPLAMVYLTADGSVMFLDTWIPRRPMASTAAASWAANMRGAPTPAAAVARLHQFQCQLSQSLDVWPVIAAADELLQGQVINLIRSSPPPERAKEVKKLASGLQIGGDRRNLYERGFRHIPPFGFLPIGAPPGFLESLRTVGRTLGMGGALLATEYAYVKYAKAQAKAYFKGTNVLTFACVALHDDDILEDMRRAMDKDPVILSHWPLPDRDECIEKLLKSLARGLKEEEYEEPQPEEGAEEGEYDPATGEAIAAPATPINTDINTNVNTDILTNLATNVSVTQSLQLAVLRSLVSMIRFGGLTIEKLINREIEVVKLIVPMEGLRRHGKGSDELAQLFQLATGVNRADLMQPAAQATTAQTFVSDFLGTSARPRHFVFYVKQRIVLLDWIYLLVDAMLDIFDLFGTAIDQGWIDCDGGDDPQCRVIIHSHALEYLIKNDYEEPLVTTTYPSMSLDEGRAVFHAVRQQPVTSIYLTDYTVIREGLTADEAAQIAENLRTLPLAPDRVINHDPQAICPGESRCYIELAFSPGAVEWLLRTATAGTEINEWMEFHFGPEWRTRVPAGAAGAANAAVVLRRGGFAEGDAQTVLTNLPEEFAELDAGLKIDKDCGAVEFGQSDPQVTNNLIRMTSSFRPAVSRSANAPYLSTEMLHNLVKVRPLRMTNLAGGMLEQPWLRDLTLDTVSGASPEMKMTGTWRLYEAEKTRLTEAHRGRGMSFEAARARARYDAIDVMLEEHPGFAALKIGAVLMTPADFDKLERGLRRRAGGDPADVPLAAVLRRGRNTVEAGARTRRLYTIARRHYGTLPASNVLDTAGSGTPMVMNRLLARGRGDAINAIGAERAEALNERVTRDGERIWATADALGGLGRIHEAAFWTRHGEAMRAHDNRPAAALADLQETGDARAQPAAKALAELFDTLGPRAYARFVNEARTLSGAGPADTPR